MNKPCLKCGSIMLVPDIPLPKTYTQKCVSCSFVNPVGDDLFYGPDSSQDFDQTGNSETDVFDMSQPTQVAEQIDFSRTKDDPDQTNEWLDRLGQVKPVQIELPATTTNDPSIFSVPSLPATTSPEPTTPKSAGISMEMLKTTLDGLRSELRDEMNKKLAELELRVMKAELKPTANPSSIDSTPTGSPSTKSPSPHRHVVAEMEVLLCGQSSAYIDLATRSMQAEGYKIHMVASPKEAIQLIKEVAFHVIVMDQRFVQDTPEGQSLLNKIKLITLPIRRHQCLVLITPRLETAESQVFYQWGADLNVKAEEVDHLGKIVNDLIDLKTDMQRKYLDSNFNTDSAPE